MSTITTNIQFLELNKFSDNHIINNVLEKKPYIYYPIQKDYAKKYKLICAKHYFEPNINLWKFEFKNRILYHTENEQTILKLVNQKLRKLYEKNLVIFNDLNDKMLNYSGNFLDDEFDILRKRYEGSHQTLINYIQWIEPFIKINDLEISFDQILPHRIVISH